MHLYEKTRVLWELFSIFGVVWVNPKTVGDTPLELWSGLHRHKKEGVARTFLLVLDSLETLGIDCLQ